MMQLRLAHEPNVELPGRGPVALAPRDAALLAWLALEGPTPRARLARLLWPDAASETARNALRQRLFQLRRQTGVELVAAGELAALAADVRHDLGEADSVLGELAFADCPELNAWLEAERRRRWTRRRQALVDLADMAEASQDYGDALAHAGEVLAIDPLSEDAHRRVMRLHYLAGDRAAALLAFDRCEQALKNDAGTRPSPDTLALLADIERSAPLHGVRARVMPASLLRPPQAVARDAELAAMHAAWAAGEPFLLLGEPGIGKSRLIELLAAGWPGAIVLRARPGDLHVPLAGSARLVSRLAARHPALRASPEMRQLDEALGAAPAPAGTGGLPTPAGRPPAPRSLAAPLGSVLAHALAAEPPLALLFDDWQFADAATIDLLEEVLAAPAFDALRRGHASRTGAGATADERIAALRARAATRVIDLAALDAAGIGALLRSLHLDALAGAPERIEALARSLHRRLGGNPLHVLEALRRLHELQLPWLPEHVQAPARVRDLVLERAAQLPDAARALLRAAAVAGADFGVELAEAVTGRDALLLAEDWQALERHGLFDRGGVAHDVYAEAVLATLPEAIGAVLHGRVARWLEGRPHEPARLAAHWRAAGDDARAVPHLVAAARRAWHATRAAETFAFFAEAAAIEVAAGRPAQAFALWFDNADAMSEIGAAAQVARCGDAMRGLAASDGERLRLRMVEAAHVWLQGASPSALAAMGELLGDAIALGDTRVECECRFAIAHRAVSDGRFDDALQHLAAAERLLRDAGEHRRAAAFAASTTMVLGMRGQPRLATREFARLLPLLEEQRDRATWLAVCSADAVQQILQGDADAAWRQAERTVAAEAEEPVAAPDTGLVLRNLVDALRWSARFGDALQVAGALARRLAELDGELRALEHLARLYLHLGRGDLAAPLLDALERTDIPLRREQLRIALLRCVLAGGRPRGSAAEQWPDAAPTCDDLALAAEWVLWSGLRGTSPWPVETLEAVTRRCQAGDATLFARPLAALTAWRLLQEGRPDRAAPWLGATATDALERGFARLHGATPWAALYAARAFDAAGRADDARCAAATGARWLADTVERALPEAFRDSFLHRSAVNRELLAMAARMACREPVPPSIPPLPV